MNDWWSFTVTIIDVLARKKYSNTRIFRFIMMRFIKFKRFNGDFNEIIFLWNDKSNVTKFEY